MEDKIEDQLKEQWKQGKNPTELRINHFDYVKLKQALFEKYPHTGLQDIKTYMGLKVVVVSALDLPSGTIILC